jgi:futalosine hydrolase
MLLLCAATSFEIAPTLQFLDEQKNRDIRVLITGVGMLAATYALTRGVMEHNPGIILQAGVAGSLDNQLQLTEVVAIENEIIGDLGVEENGSFKDLFKMGLLNGQKHPFTNDKLVNNNSLLKNCGLKQVNGVTVNEVSTAPGRINYYRSLASSVESLEGAALHYVGLMENIPFLQVRSVSNFAGERNKDRWRLKDAITSLNNELQQLIDKILPV